MDSEPKALEAEMSVLGAVFVDPDFAMPTVDGILYEEDFSLKHHCTIYSVMRSLFDSNEPIDLVSVSTVLKDRGMLEKVGGMSYIATLVDYVPMAANVAFYAKTVKEKAQARTLINKATQAAALARQGGEYYQGAVELLESAIAPELVAQANGPVDIGKSVKEASKRIEERYRNKGQITGIPYGLADLDEVTLGLHPGELIIVAGRPSMGKSAFAGNIIKSVCIEGGTASLFTLEMGRLDIVDRLAASYNIKYQNIRSGTLEEMEWMRLHKAMDKIKDWQFPIDDTPAISLRDLRARARKQKRDGLDLLVVDYLQLMSLSDPKMNRVQGLGEISRGLKQLARELEIPVIALSQLSRSVDSRNDKRPMMSDLRDSGEIEQDADVILFPYRPAAYCEKCKDRIDDNEHKWKEHQCKAEIIIEKQRAGERNISVPVIWLGEFQRFENQSKYSGGLPE